MAKFLRSLFLIWSIALNALISLAQESMNKPSLIQLGHFTRTEFLIGPSIILIRDSPVTLYEKPVIDYGFAVGFGKSYWISKHFQLAGRILYERKGGKTLDAEQVGSVIYKNAFTTSKIYTCITLPMNVRYTFGNRIHYNFEVGMFFGFTLKAAIDQSSSVSNFKSYYEITKDAEKFDFGYSTSFGIVVPLNESNELSLRLFNTWGIPNVLDVSTDTWRTFSLIFLIGYQIPSF